MIINFGIYTFVYNHLPSMVDNTSSKKLLLVAIET